MYYSGYGGELRVGIEQLGGIKNGLLKGTTLTSNLGGVLMSKRTEVRGLLQPK